VEALRLLFDIVNVQNWSAAPRSARGGSPCRKVAFDRGSAAADHLFVFDLARWFRHIRVIDFLASPA
jgi:hypothetical protein